jgi:hypothetical protein
MILLFGQTCINRSAVREGALIPNKIHLSYRIFGPVCGSDWCKHAETWKVFWRSQFALDNHILGGKGDKTIVSFRMKLELFYSVDPEGFYGTSICYYSRRMREKVSNIHKFPNTNIYICRIFILV